MSNNKFHEFIKAVKSKDLATVEKSFQVQYLKRSDNEGYNPIHHACLNNSEEIFKYFLKRICDIESCDAHNCRPIHCAIHGGAVEIVKLLIGHRCNLDCETDKGETLLDLANQITENRKEITKILKMAIANRKIGIEMDLKCHFDCDHGFCLISFFLNKFSKKNVIGEGACGKVIKISESRGNREFAVKKVTWMQLDSEKKNKDSNISDITKESKYLENNINEYKDMLRHENIIRYFGAIREDCKMLIFMEYADGGSVSDKIFAEYQDGLPHNLIIKYSYHILKGLDFLHKKTIIHRDIKTANILLDRNDICKLTDLGFSRLLESISKHKTNSKTQKSEKNENKEKKNAVAKTFCGTANYMAPEIMNGEPYLYPCDLWSLGATIIEMLTGKPPYWDQSQNTVFLKIGIDKNIEYKAPNLSAEMKKFIDQLLKPKPENRGSPEELLKISLFQSLKEN